MFKEMFCKVTCLFLVQEVIVYQITENERFFSPLISSFSFFTSRFCDLFNCLKVTAFFQNVNKVV